MDINDNITQIRELILKNKHPSYTTTNKKELRVRCPYCGDSKKDKNSAHLYIEMKPPFRFHCFKCETSGVLNQQVLRDLDLNINDLGVSIVSANKDYRSNSAVAKVSTKKRKLNNEPADTLISQNAVNYFNSRYNTAYTNDYIVRKFKAVTDAFEFFKQNNISVPVDKYNRMMFDFTHAIGFISSDGSHVIFRDTTGTSPKRYYNLNLDPYNDDVSSKVYNISSDIDILKDRVTLVITEGIFDIIGVYNAFYNDYSGDNMIFAAACGKAYNTVILKYIRMGFLNIDIVIYSDADVDSNFFRYMKKNSPYIRDSQITIYYNGLYNPQTGYGKDFGVPKEQIELKKVII